MLAPPVYLGFLLGARGSHLARSARLAVLPAPPLLLSANLAPKGAMLMLQAHLPSQIAVLVPRAIMVLLQGKPAQVALPVHQARPLQHLLPVMPQSALRVLLVISLLLLVMPRV